MFKKLLIIQSVLIILFLNMSSSFVYAGFFSDHIQTNTVPAPSVPYDDSLFNGEISTDIDSDYLNSDHLVEGETETELFDEKSEFHTTVDAPSTSNSSKSTKDELSSGTSNIANSTKLTEIQSSSNQDDSQSEQSDQFVYEYYKHWGRNHNTHLPITNPHYLVNDILGIGINGNADITYSGYSMYVTNSPYSSQFPTHDSLLNSGLVDVKNLFVFSYQTRQNHTMYGFIFTSNDRIDLVSYDNTLGGSNYTFPTQQFSNSDYLAAFCFGGFTSDDVFQYYSFDYLFCKIGSKMFSFSVPGGSDSFYFGSTDTNVTPVYIGSDIDVYFDDEKQEKYNEDGTLAGDIKGEFKLNEKSNILSYRAYSDKVLDKTYDIHLWAVDNDSVPAKINGSENFPIRDLNTYLDHDLQLSSNKQSVKASINLEDVYYYLHQMNGYDGSIESVNGYEFDKFESRENIIFAIAYRESKSSLDWIVCKSYKYNYRDLIENVMGGFSVKKDYVDFPSLSDYVEGFPSIEDFLPDDEDPGILDWILAFIKWIANCVYIGFKNFIGLFQWLFDCIPILWENLTIALYNLVCDLKELALYFVYPKTESIYAMANERCPAFKQLYSAVSQDASSSSLPSFIFFGTKFSLNLNDYGIDFSYVKSISQVIIWIFYFWCIWCIIRKVIGLAPSDGDDS